MGVTQIGDNQIGYESGVSFFSLVACLPYIPQKSSPCYGYLTCLEWTKHLSPGDLLKTSWCWMTEKQKFSENSSPFLHLCYDTGWLSPDPLSFSSILLVLLPQFRPPFLLPPSLTSIQIYPSTFSLPNHRTSFLRLPTVTLPYLGLTDLPPPPVQAADLCLPVHLKLSSNQSCTAQLKLR